jgi:preprotein translocase subunit SecD
MGTEKIAQVRPLSDRRIEVALLRWDEAETEKVKKLLANTAVLEFRILASDQRHKAILARATADPSKSRIVDDKGNVLAWWVPVKTGAEAIVADYSDIARRTKKRGKDEITEVLVVKDDQDLTGTYLKRTEAGIDRRGQPELTLIFNTRGRQLFSQLTGSHLPDKATNFNYKLGVIFNGQLFSAPLIVSTVYDRAELTVCFSRQELNEMVRLLRAGSLPVRIRPVAMQKPS